MTSREKALDLAYLALRELCGIMGDNVFSDLLLQASCLFLFWLCLFLYVLPKNRDISLTFQYSVYVFGRLN